MTDSFEALHGYFIEDLAPGMSATLSKTFVERDVTLYATLSTDDNPLHMNEEFAARTRADGRVIHGMLTASLISALVGTRLPGPGCLWMAQEIRFLKPVRMGETVVAVAEVTELRPERQRVRLSTVCKVGERIVLDGHALTWVPSRSAR